MSSIDGSFDFWKTDVLPNNLEDLLKETVINNSFTEEDTVDELTESMKSSFAYLHRYQELASHFKRFDYRTREFLQETSYSVIQDTVREQTKVLEDETSSEEAKENAKKLITDLLEIQFGDFYIDKNNRVCVDIDYNMIMPAMRDMFRTSFLYGKELRLSDIANNKGIFIETAIVIVDNYVHTDVKIIPKDKCTTFVFKKLTKSDIYTREESKQIEHDLTVLFIENTYFTNVNITLRENESSAYSGMTNTALRLSLSSLQPSSEVYEILNRNDGMFVAACSANYHEDSAVEKHIKSSLLTSVVVEGDDVIIETDPYDPEFREFKEYFIGTVVTVSLYYLEGFHKFTSAYHGYDGLIYERNKLYTGQHDEGYTGSEVGYAMPYFIPTDTSYERYGENYDMPIPKENMFVLKNMNTGLGHKRTVTGFEKDVTVESFYPNIYQIQDPNMTNNDTYYVFYFYKRDERKYTPLFKFYEDWMKLHFNLTFEEALNKVYLNMYQNDYQDIDRSKADILYSVFKKIIEYKDYEYFYSTPDFIHSYTGDDIPLQYKIARMREFVRADWHVLERYVKREKKNMSLLHFFTNTIKLSGRKRRSTRLEDPRNPVVFAERIIRSSSSDPEALLVSNSKSYDFNTEIYIDDAKIELPDIEAGEYVKCIGLTNRYVFAFKNDDENRDIPFHVFIDGILVADIYKVHRYGMEYIYIPMRYVSEDSYIMMERDFFIHDPVKVDVTLPGSTDNFVTAHFIEQPHLAYTMNDVYIETDDGRIVPKDKYEIRIERNRVGYGMYDERHDTWNKFGIVTDVQFRMKSDISTYGTRYRVCIDKDTINFTNVSHRTGYPRVYLENFDSVDELNYVRMFSNGRLVDNSLYKLGKKGEATIVQSRIKSEKGETFVFEITPYSRKLILTLENLPESYILDFSKVIGSDSPILNKPFDPEYYEIYVNGRRLGLPNAFELGPHHGVLRGLHSKYRLEIYEKERDFEYFGYECLNVDTSKHNYDYYYAPMDFISTEGLMTQAEKEQIISNYIDLVKHPNAVIKPNVNDEEKLDYLVQFNIAEDMAIFYYEDLLPLGLANPDEVQFNKEYLEGMYPYLCEVYLKEDPVENNKWVFFVDPDIATHSNNLMTGNTYEIINIDDMNMNLDTTYIYLIGENGIQTYE